MSNLDARYEEMLKERDNMLLPQDTRLDNILKKLDGYEDLDTNFTLYLNNIKQLRNELKGMKKELSECAKHEKELNELSIIVKDFRENFKKKSEKVSRELKNIDFHRSVKNIMESEIDKDLNKYLKTVTDKGVETRNKFQLLYSKYKSMTNKIVELLNNEELEDEIMNNETSCPICYESKISHCINPCGHTFCADCVKNLNGECFMCRVKVRNVIKMFITFNEKDNENSNTSIPIASNDIPVIQPFPLNTNPQEVQNISYFDISGGSIIIDNELLPPGLYQDYYH